MAWVAGLLTVAPAVAQTVPLPGSADPGRLEKRFEQPQLPKSTLEPVIPETPDQAPPPDADEIKFTLTGIVIDGATVYSQRELQSFYDQLLGKEVSLADIYRVAEKITAKYGNDGYALSRAVVPAQRISNGIVRLQVIEGYIDKVIIEGQTGGAGDVIREYGEKIAASKPLKAQVLERYLLLANDLPGIKVESVLKASEANLGASNLVLVSQYKPVSASAALDNRGSRSSGPHQETLSLSGNSLTGLAEQTTLRYIRAGNNELRYVQFAHQEQIGTEGTKLNLTANRSRSTSGYNVKYLEAVSRSFTGGFDITHPFIRTRAETLNGKIGFTYKNSHSLQLAQTSSEDRTRVLTVGGTYDFADTLGGSNLIALDLHKGLNIMSATEQNRDLLSRQLGRSDFFKATAEITRTQPLWGKFAMVGGVTGQWSAHNLLASEEFGYGGSQYGRAYDSSEITGDHGIAAKVELQYTEAFPDWNIKYVQPYVFYDVGKVYQKVHLAAERPHEAAASAGIGIRAGLTDWISGQFEIARPLTHDVAARAPDDARATRFFFGLTAAY